MNIKNKTGRKNKTKLELVLPSLDYFSTEQLLDSNPDMPKITARTKFKMHYLNAGKIKELGHIQNDMGRPTKVYAAVPISSKVIDSAKNEGIILKNEYIVEKVADITQSTPNNNSFNVVNKPSKVAITF